MTVGSINCDSLSIVERDLEDRPNEAMLNAVHYSVDLPILAGTTVTLNRLVGLPLYNAVQLISTGEPDPDHPKLSKFLKECAG
jgi:hypothetical protein